MEDVRFTKEADAADEYVQGPTSPAPIQKTEKELSPETTSIDEEKAVPVSVVKDTSQVNDDPNIVGWDGPDDPDMALNWPARKK